MNKFLLNGLSTLSLMLFLVTGMFAQMVTTTADSGPGSLRDVVAAAAPGATITFDASTDGNMIVLTSGEIMLNTVINIQGNGTANTMISGNNNSRIFNIATTAVTVTISELSMTEGNAPMGGAVMVGPVTTATLTGVTISNSVATGAAATMGGGAVAVMQSTLNVEGSSFSGNSATGASGSGGAILSGDGGVLTISDSRFANNTASRAGGAIEDVSGAVTVTTITDTDMAGNSTGAAPGNGGGVHVTGPGNLSYTGGRVTNNTAASEGGGLWNGTGTMTVTDVVFVNNDASGDDATNGGGALFNAGGTLNVSGGTIIRNRASGAAGSGGGIFNDAGILTVTRTLIKSNQANRAGGGVEETAGSTATLDGARLVGNDAGASPGNGGGMHITGAGDVTITGGNVILNKAANEGGGLWNGSGTMTINDGFLRRNVASGAGADAGGGAIYNLSGTVNVNEGTVIRQNEADGAAGSGGGILNDVGGNINITGTEFALNTANRAGGAIEDNSGAEGIVTIDNTLFLKNSAGSAPGNGGAIHITGPGVMDITGGAATGNVASREGGAFWNGSGTMTVTDVNFNLNRALGTAADDGGGALFNNGGTLMVSGGLFNGNTAMMGSGSGGAIFNATGGTLMVDGGNYIENSAARAGGAIEDASDAGTTMTITGATMSRNVTGAMPGNGGAIHISAAGDADITGGSYRDNVAAREGGALWNGAGTMTISGVIVNGNRAEGPMATHGGGGVYNAGGTVMIMDQTQILFNEATGASGSGGGIFNATGGTLTVDRSQLKGNTANRAGGGIEDASGADGSVTMMFANLVGNSTGSAPGNGGGLHVTGPGTVDIDGGLILNNTAAAEGGGLWNGTGTMTVNRAKISGNVAMGNDPDQGGGGIYNLNEGTLNIGNNTRFTNNMATGTAGSGGAILNDDGATLTVSGALFSGNTASRAGGAIEDTSNSGTTVTIRSSDFTGNSTGSAPGNGGAIHISGDGDMEITRSNFSGNTAAREGGALWNGLGTMTVTQTDVIENSAAGPAADDGGGGIFNNGGMLIVDRSTVSINDATGAAATGGGIMSIGGSVEVMTSTITANSASVGGGIWSDGMLMIANATIAANSASVTGGGVVTTDNSSANLFSSIVAANVSEGTADLLGATVISDGNNVIGQDDDGILMAVATDTVGTADLPLDPMVGPLSQNGGPTLTHNLMCDSPAIDFGAPSDTGLDQGGRARFGGVRDAGAFERRSRCDGPDIATITNVGDSEQLTASDLSFDSESMSVYPNPAPAQFVNVIVPANFGDDVRLELFDLTGRVISSRQVTAGNARLNLIGQVEGTYLVRLTAGEQTATQKLIVR